MKYVAGRVALMHSVDSRALLDAIEARGARPGVPGPGQRRRRGAASAASRRGDLPALLDRFAAADARALRGADADPAAAATPAPHFAALRALRDREAARARPNVDLRELSMGMSDDLEVAVAEGATIVRVGTAIFGPRPVLASASCFAEPAVRLKPTTALFE